MNVWSSRKCLRIRRPGGEALADTMTTAPSSVSPGRRARHAANGVEWLETRGGLSRNQRYTGLAVPIRRPYRWAVVPLAVLFAMVTHSCSDHSSSRMGPSASGTQGESSRSLVESSGHPGDRANISEGELLELWTNVDCATKLENGCSGFVVANAASSPYLFLSVWPEPGRQSVVLATRSLMSVVQRSGHRFAWLQTIVMAVNQPPGISGVQVARISLEHTGEVTPYEAVYSRIAWVNRESFLPGVGDIGSIPLSAPWKN